MGVDGDFVLCLGGRVEFCKMYLNITLHVFSVTDNY